MKKSTVLKRLSALILVLLFVLSGCGTFGFQKDPGLLTVHFIDVGQADSMLLIAGETTVLIDGGNTDTGPELLTYLRRFGVTELDLVVNTHPHGDHLGGLPTVLGGIPAKTVWTSTKTYDSYTFDRFMNAAEKHDSKIQVPAPGTTYKSSGLTITVLGPVGKYYVDLNNTSLVLMVEFGNRKFLFTGDMETLAENQLVEKGVDLKADVLKVGHHGSYSSTGKVFLNRVAPEFGVISCGWENEYGHPHDAPLHRLEDKDVTLYRTDLMGDVIAVTNGKTLAFFLETADIFTGYEKAA